MRQASCCGKPHVRHTRLMAYVSCAGKQLASHRLCRPRRRDAYKLPVTFKRSRQLPDLASTSDHREPVTEELPAHFVTSDPTVSQLLMRLAPHKRSRQLLDLASGKPMTNWQAKLGAASGKPTRGRNWQAELATHLLVSLGKPYSQSRWQAELVAAGGKPNRESLWQAELAAA